MAQGGLSHKMDEKAQWRKQQMDRMRIDKWLWAVRFFKTRSLATDEINHGRVQIDQCDVKPSREIRVGDVITILQAKMPRTVIVKGLSEQRGPALVAQQLYEETPESQEARAKAIERNRLSPEPALTIAHGRPTKRDRRDLQKSFYVD
jgi:ribosome-associated heat shock protein Hsp15